MDNYYPLALSEGSVLAGQYVITKILGQGGFGITYQAKDHKTGKRVAIKEFFPDSLATRSQGQTSVMPYSGDRGDNFRYGMRCFVQEAETLAQFIGNENIVRVYSYFEENGTAYFVMDYIEGTTLEDYIKQNGGRLTFEDASRILVPVMDALGAVHEKGIVHRDVSPDNIYLTNDGSVKLIDFGAARQSLGDKSQSLDVVLKHGFAPKEQYSRRGKQGPFTDVYALGATFYFALTGKRPPDALERLDEDDLVLPSTLGAKLPKDAENAIIFALNVRPEKRFQSMAAFKKAFLGTNKVHAPAAPNPTVMQPNPAPVQNYSYAPQNVYQVPNAQGNIVAPATPTPKKFGAKQIGIIVAIVGAIIAAVILFKPKAKDDSLYYNGIPWGTSAEEVLKYAGQGYSMVSESGGIYISNDTNQFTVQYMGCGTGGQVYYGCDIVDNNNTTWQGLCWVNHYLYLTSDEINTIINEHNKLFGDPIDEQSNYITWENGKTGIEMSDQDDGSIRIFEYSVDYLHNAKLD